MYVTVKIFSGAIPLQKIIYPSLVTSTVVLPDPGTAKRSIGPSTLFTACFCCSFNCTGNCLSNASHDISFMISKSFLFLDSFISLQYYYFLTYFLCFYLPIMSNDLLKMSVSFICFFHAIIFIHQVKNNREKNHCVIDITSKSIYHAMVLFIFFL